MENIARAKRLRRVPVVLSVDEVRRLLAALDCRSWLPASLLYGSGMRSMDALRLRVKGDWQYVFLPISDRAIHPGPLLDRWH